MFILPLLTFFAIFLAIDISVNKLYDGSCDRLKEYPFTNKLYNTVIIVFAIKERKFVYFVGHLPLCFEMV